MVKVAVEPSGMRSSLLGYLELYQSSKLLLEKRLWQKRSPQEAFRMGTTQRDGRENLTFGSDDHESRERLRQLILFVAERCQADPGFSMAKLVEILFRADFESFARYGRSITGARYRKLHYGPASQAALDVRDEMKSRGEIELMEEGYTPHRRNRVVALKTADLHRFTGTDIALIDKVIGLSYGRTATFAGGISHDRAWEAADYGELIPYEAALLSDEAPTEDDIARAHELGARYGWED
jgi:hypothetical protein